jgi:hypothetical protein
MAGSYFASLIVHALIAALLFSIATSSSEEGASEVVSGGTIVTLEQPAPVVAQAAAPAHQAAPVPNVPRTAPIVRQAPLVLPARQPLPPLQHHELSKFAPTAPPNPTPLPQASTRPNPQPTTAVVEQHPENALPAVPTVAPSVPVESVAVKIPPTEAPSPMPSATATAAPSPLPPAPTAAPTAKPATPAPPQPTVAPTAVALAVRATAAPSATPEPVSRPSAAPLAKTGVPSPSPTQAPKLTQTTSGTAPTPGPKGQSSPGPRAGSAGVAKAAPSRPISVPPTPRPASTTAAGHGIDINAKLRAMLPHNVVNPTQVSEVEHVSLNGRLDPTPPPEVLAQTKYIFEQNGSGGDVRVKMWVTGVRRVGPVLYCDGWLLRYPHASQPPPMQGTFTHPVSGSIEVSSGGLTGGVLPPVIEEHASTACSERALTPFAPSPASSP